ncbi:hypothetical protein WN55_03075 [Dufourea novaeangliae]|uniref:Uncharacterized protein n=1 Tax=Dufourea novaeangliae TaxID=178035 RepID=A0A154PI17_DUFNO|nr:hypothetical protein WN55_03075 [Dufourea novaeangliae]
MITGKCVDALPCRSRPTNAALVINDSQSNEKRKRDDRLLVVTNLKRLVERRRAK